MAVLTAGAVFLAAWLPFNNGLRPEPVIAFGTIAAWVLVENAIGTRRLWPAAVAIVIAVFSVTTAPQGLIALAPILVGARAIARNIRARKPADGVLAQIAPLAASLSLIFVVVFRDQTLATVAESARIKYVVGPTIAWYQEFLRYYFLTVEDSADSSLTRRFAVLVMLLCLFGMIAVLLRRGNLPGVASGPVWRLIGTTAIGLLLLTFTPTKWAVQFGAFAGLAGALGAVTAFVFARVGLHTRRNLAVYVTALLFILAWATSGINAWFYVGNYGVPWFDKQPVIAGVPVTFIFLALAMLTGLLAGWLHFRMDYAGHTEVANTGRNRVLASTPLLVVAVIMVVLEVGLDGQGRRAALSRLHHRQGQRAGAGIRAEQHQLRDGRRRARRAGHQCRYVATGSGSTLRTVRTAGRREPGRIQPERGQRHVGARRARDVQSGNGELRRLAQQAERGSRLRRGDQRRVRPRGSQRVAGLPALRPRPEAHAGDGQLRREHRRRQGHLVLVPVATAHTGPSAGDRRCRRGDLVLRGGPLVQLRPVAQAAVGCASTRRVVPGARPGPADRHLHAKGLAQPAFPDGLGTAGGQRGALVADDPNLSTDQWFAFTPPRVPVLETAQQMLGSDTPVLMDIATSANFPCQRPFSEHLGVAQLPEYRILPNLKQTVVSSNQWQSLEDGGPLLITKALLRSDSVPSYLRDDWYRDWGAIERYYRLVPESEAPDAVIDQGSVTVRGWTRNGPIRALPMSETT